MLEANFERVKIGTQLLEAGIIVFGKSMLSVSHMFASSKPRLLITIKELSSHK